ncbi:hypothetical protein [Alteribacter salitolerans]|nr:hypothetical protein [Alteribacter salitolerans]
MKKIIAFALLTSVLFVGTGDVSFASDPDWVMPFSVTESAM